MSTKRIEEVIGQNIRTLRSGRYSQSEFGKKLGEYLDKPWPAQTVSSAEKGDRAFVAAETAAIAHVFDVPIARLFAPQLDVAMVQITPKLSVGAERLHSSRPSDGRAAQLEEARQCLRTMQASHEAGLVSMGRLSAVVSSLAEST